MTELVLSGDEAIAQAALDAGLSGGFAYPGTPSTEIMEYLQEHLGDKRADAEDADGGAKRDGVLEVSTAPRVTQ
jgi:pyruvate/2-oxoacid:ferredoxin oxidoreductase alpha subunit